MTPLYNPKLAASVSAMARKIIGTNLCKEIYLTDTIWKMPTPITMAIKRPSKPKYQFSRAKWFTASINDSVLWRLSAEYNDIIEWCTEQFGPHPARQDAWSRWWVGLGDIKFRDQRDYQWFVLRWGA